MEERYYSLAEARKLMPQISGAPIAIHDRNHSWECRYPVPNDIFPTTRSKVFNPEDGASQFSTMLQCLAWAWRHHKRQTGQDCPWDLGEAL